MSQQFSFSRFGRLLGRHTAEHLPAYLMMAAVLAGGMLLVMGFLSYLQGEAPSPDAQMVFFILFLLAAGSVFTSGVFAQFGDAKQAIVALTLPASHLEKYLVAWLYSLPGFLLVFIPVFYLVDAVVVYGSTWQGHPVPVLNLFSAPAELRSVLFFFAVLHAVWLWGAVYFEKMHFIKMGFVLFLLAGVVSIFNFQVLRALLGPALRAAPPFTDVTLMEGKQFYLLALPAAPANWLAVLPVAVAGLLWVAAYFRVTEKQI